MLMHGLRNEYRSDPAGGAGGGATIPAMQRPSLRALAVVAAGLAFGVTAAVRIAPITPSLDIQVVRTTTSPQRLGYRIFCKARGAEPAEELRIEVVSGPVHLIGNTAMTSLPAMWRVGFEVQLERTGEKGRVRVVKKGSAPESYELDLTGDEQ